MSWFLVDDQLPFSPDVRKLSGDPLLKLAAFGLWALGGAWCGQQLTDGHIDEAIASGLASGRVELIDVLVTAGWWIPVEDGYQVAREWDEPKPRQPLRSKVLATREARRSAGGRGGKASGQTRRGKAATPGAEVGEHSKGEATDEAIASGFADALVTNPMSMSMSMSMPLDKPLLTLVSRLSSGNAHATTTDIEFSQWQSVAGPGTDLEVEARAWLAFNQHRWDDISNPGGAWLGWLKTARNRPGSHQPGISPADIAPAAGCGDCLDGWLADDTATGAPRPCPTCRSHLVRRLDATHDAQEASR